MITRVIRKNYEKNFYRKVLTDATQLKEALFQAQMSFVTTAAILTTDVPLGSQLTAYERGQIKGQLVGELLGDLLLAETAAPILKLGASLVADMTSTPIGAPVGEYVLAEANAGKHFFAQGKPLGTLAKEVVDSGGKVGALNAEKVVQTFTEKAAEGKNVFSKLLTTAKRTNEKQMESVLEDGSKVLFRRDVGEHAHALGGAYRGQGPINHYNVEIHVPKPDGGFKPKQNYHLILDNDFNVIDFIK